MHQLVSIYSNVHAFLIFGLAPLHAQKLQLSFGTKLHSELHNVIFVTRIKIWVQNFTPKTRKSRLFVFTTKHVNPLLFGLTAEVSGVKLPQLNGFLNKDLHSVKNAYVTPKKFTPDLQIFYTFPVFGLNVHVLGVKVPPNAMKRIIFIKLYPTSKRRMLLSENLPQTSRFFTRIYPQYPWHYATLLTYLQSTWLWRYHTVMNFCRDKHNQLCSIYRECGVSVVTELRFCPIWSV